ncbi:MAG: FtsX-like permease family protein [Bacteroidota bacterium]
MNFLFAWRYFKAKKSTNAINIIAWISMAAIIVGSASLIIVLSVFNGFEGLVKSLYSNFYTDLRISPQTGKTIILTQDQLKQLSSVNGIKGYSLIAEDKAFVQNGDLNSIVFLKGVDSNYTKISSISEKIVRGKFEPGDADHANIILGSGIENALGVETDKNVLPLSVYLFKKTNGDAYADPAQFISNENVATSGTFSIQAEFDNKYGFTNLGFMKHMLGFANDEYSAVEIAVNDAKNPDMVKSRLQKLFPGNYIVQTRYEQNQNLYGVMRTEKWFIYCVLSLILVVAAFNMIGALTMLVLEKKDDINVLKALGANDNYIQRIFLSEGMLLAVMGGAGGILLAIIICWLQVRYKLVPIQGGSFLIDYYPVKLVATDFLLVFITVLIVALIASWFPSRKAAKQELQSSVVG